MLDIKLTSSSDVVNLAGRFDGAGAVLFDQQLRPMESRQTPLVLDFGGVSYLSSAGIRSLVQLEKKLRAHGARIILVALQSSVMQTLEMSGLLSQFALASSVDLALSSISDAASGLSSAVTITINGRSVSVSRLPSSPSQIELWGGERNYADPDEVSKALLNVTLSELPLAVGLGGFGNNREQAMESFGGLMTSGTTAMLTPADGQGCVDFLQSEKPEAVSFYLAEAAAVRGKPALFLQLDWKDATVGELAASLPGLVAQVTGATPSALGFLLHAPAQALSYSFGKQRSDYAAGQPEVCSSTGEEDVLVLGLVGVGSNEDSVRLSRFRPREWFSVSPATPYLGYGIRLAGHQPDHNAHEPAALFAEALKADRFLGVARIHPETKIGRAKVWVYLPGRVVEAAEKRLKIEINGTMKFPDEWDLITRRIYTDASRVVLTQMSGGYSATTMQADSYDLDGRRMIPTVLKISSLATTASEVKAYHENVKKFILNNSTVIMGHATQGNWAGLRYNFVGVNGPGSTLSWLADHYTRRPVPALKPLFDAVFGQILWPWYGQPKREVIRPFDQHNPSHIFPTIAEEAMKVLGVSADEPTIRCEELGRDLPNPYHFLRHEFPKLKTWEKSWFSTITHGDLNLNNILIDEKVNIYVIDFSETRPRNALSDFARIEPLITLQMTRLEEPGDMKDLLRFLEGLVAVSPLKGDPPLRYTGTDPLVEKAWHIITLLRGYGRKVVAGEDQPIFYWLPLLEWTIPIVCFRQLEPTRKRLSMYASALLCEKIKALV